MRSTGLEPVRSPTRPSNVRVCLFRHDRMTHILYTIPGSLSSPERKIIAQNCTGIEPEACGNEQTRSGGRGRFAEQMRRGSRACGSEREQSRGRGRLAEQMRRRPRGLRKRAGTVQRNGKVRGADAPRVPVLRKRAGTVQRKGDDSRSKCAASQAASEAPWTLTVRRRAPDGPGCRRRPNTAPAPDWTVSCPHRS